MKTLLPLPITIRERSRFEICTERIKNELNITNNINGNNTNKNTVI